MKSKKTKIATKYFNDKKLISYAKSKTKKQKVKPKQILNLSDEIRWLRVSCIRICHHIRSSEIR